MSHTLFQLDAFTEKPFRGNPAAVCVLSHPETDDWMQSVAAEMNLSETAFLLREGEDWRLRWFTPKTEVDLCGHATLASATVLFATQNEPESSVLKFHTRSGQLFAHRVPDGIALDFPAMAYAPFRYDPVIISVLGFVPVAAVFSGDYYLFEAQNAALIRDAQPEIDLLKKLPMSEVIITARDDQGEFDFLSRFFAPRFGIDEDPVTGSAHCLLATYWADQLGKKDFNAYQASRRGGSLRVRLEGNRVQIIGKAVFIFKADLLI